MAIHDLSRSIMGVQKVVIVALEILNVLYQRTRRTTAAKQGPLFRWRFPAYFLYVCTRHSDDRVDRWAPGSSSSGSSANAAMSELATFGSSSRVVPPGSSFPWREWDLNECTAAVRAGPGARQCGGAELGPPSRHLHLLLAVVVAQNVQQSLVQLLVHPRLEVNLRQNEAK
jgi:hypothetical protein